MILLIMLSIFFLTLFITFTWAKIDMKKKSIFFEENKVAGKAVVSSYGSDENSSTPFVRLVGDDSHKSYVCRSDLKSKDYPIGTEVSVYYAFKDTLLGPVPIIKVIGYEDNNELYAKYILTAIQIVGLAGMAFAVILILMEFV